MIPFITRMWIKARISPKAAVSASYSEPPWWRFRARSTAPGFVGRHEWPVVVSVPVCAIEAWLLTAQALAGNVEGDLYAESLSDRDAMKRRIYPSRARLGDAVEEVALPLLRALPDVRKIADYSRSFRLFVQQIDSLRDQMAACLAYHKEMLT